MNDEVTALQSLFASVDVIAKRLSFSSSSQLFGPVNAFQNVILNNP